MTMATPRVMQVVLSLDPGGTERLVIEIAARLADAVDMRVCCLDAPGDWATELPAQGVAVHSLSRRPGFHPSLGYQVAKIAREHRIDVLHCHHYSPFVYGQLAALFRPGLRVVFTEHGRLSDNPPSPKRKFVNPLLGRLPFRIFAVSADLRRHMIAEGLPSGRIGVIHNGIEPGREPTAFERTEAKRALGLRPDEVLVGTIGRLDRVKDFPTLIRAIAIARASGLRCKLAIVGSGPEQPALAETIRALNLGEFVQLLGHRNDARAVLPAFDLYVNSSIHEGVSLTLLEAMAAALPTIATRAGGNPEVVVHGETGLLVPPRDARAQADAIRALMRAPLNRQAMGREARARVLEHFSVDRMVRRYHESYCGSIN
jgi:glycosyltransferase involved in cell wall biosynthesis